MELSEFALRILHSTDLEEKLAGPGEPITDENPDTDPLTPDRPGRPDSLVWGSQRERASFPGLHQLEDNEQRGLLLHFFANHELLATELMALVLVKFPKAPAAFRQGVYDTLREEQFHTRWYKERMKQCGVNFGDYPVSGFFWDMVAPMETPLDYVTRLSLTFEQANLDYARHYATAFAAAGDATTARILDRIYRDEIGHVGYGLEWFRRWKTPGQNDWEAFRKQLVFPLSPSRAKGNGVPFNQTGRLAAGLDHPFVTSLEIFERSRGRTPNVYWFTPDEEAAMAQESGSDPYHAPKATLELTADLEILPAFLAWKDDVVLARHPPCESHIRYLRSAGFIIPEFEALSPSGTLRSDSLTRQRKLNELRPWGWGPLSHALLHQLERHTPPTSPRISSCWNKKRRTAYSKASDLQWQQTLAETGAMDPAIVGFSCSDLNACEKALAAIAERGFHHAMMKAPFGAAGRSNHKVATQGRDHSRILTWLAKILASQGEVVVEPFLPRLLDFSVQYEVRNQQVQKIGVAWLENDRRGQFCSATCTRKLPPDLPPELARFLMEFVLPHYETNGIIGSMLGNFAKENDLHGPFGVDAFLYETAEGKPAVKLLVELNPRFTMGRLACELYERVSAGHSIRFSLVPLSQRPSEWKPLVIDAKGKMCRGWLSLNDSTTAKRMIALLEVGKDVKEFHSFTSSPKLPPIEQPTA